jgi:hypothetical protein
MFVGIDDGAQAAVGLSLEVAKMVCVRTLANV